MPAPDLSSATRDALAQLQERMRQIEGARAAGEHPPVGTGCPRLDALLPAGGLQRGTLLECFPAAQSSGGTGPGMLAMLLAKAAAASGEAVVVVDREKTFYPPAAVALGIPWEQLLVVRPRNAKEELWAIDQSLRCAGVAAVWAPLVKIGAHDFRRLQLAAESSEVVGLLLRDSPWRKEPSWAHVQIAVAPSFIAAGRKPSGESRRHTGRLAPLRFPHQHRHLQVTVLRIRGAKLNATAKRAVVQIDEVTGQFHQQPFRSASVNHVLHPVHPFPVVARAAADRGTA